MVAIGMTEREEIHESFAGVRAHVIGLGSYGTGREVARVLAARGASVVVSDVKSAAELGPEIDALGQLGIKVQMGEEAYRGIEEADLVVPSPGVPLSIPPLLRAREAGARVVSEIEIAYRIARCPLIAVTGTKGKSTTATLIGEILHDEGIRVQVGGNIGRPLIALAETVKEDEVLVAEVSSFQLEATDTFRPHVAVVLNLFPDHLDRHVDMGEYRAAKAKLFANQQPDDTAVLNRDDREVWAMRGETRASVVPFSLSEPVKDGADLVDGWLQVRGRGVCRETDVRLLGRHNLANALAALAAADAAGASLNRAGETLSRFQGLEHRLEPAGEIGGVRFVNDSQATTPEAAIAALRSFTEHVVLIAGGRAKVSDFSALATAAAGVGSDLVLIGEAAESIGTAAAQAGVARISRARDLPEAVHTAYQQAQPKGVVLLSPACASFDMFENMSARGRAFKGIVSELAVTERSE
ncbi:MAG: UDP-N-acetylmuramoyl-L-alanine--D-glutamate ligase [Armatimonadetes bacterium]|nr:UDP-N-acetylmuramoyl-L-alanine--D-glutamate ligase [Armatimonadota bacterium]